MCICEFFASGDLVEINDGLSNTVESTHMGDHSGWIKTALIHQIDIFEHIIRRTTAGTYNVCGSIMHIIEVEFGGKILFCRAGKEVKTAVCAKQCVALFDYGFYRRKYKDVIKPSAVCQFQNTFSRVFGMKLCICVDVYKLYSV